MRITKRTGRAGRSMRIVTATMVLALVSGCAAVHVRPDREARMRDAASERVVDGLLALDSDDFIDANEAAVRATIREIVERHRRDATPERRQELSQAIYRESVMAGVDPLFVASIVATESSFRSRAVSSVGAVGLMQLRPAVAHEVALRAELDWSGPEMLRVPEVNLRLGIEYLKHLLDRFDGDPVKALTAYNYGPTRVSLKLQDGSFESSFYAERILRLFSSLDATSNRRLKALGRDLPQS